MWTTREKRGKVTTRATSLVCLVPLTAGLAACGRTQSQTQKVLRLGILGPFTGPSSRTGEELKASVQMAFEAISYKIGDYRVALTWIDEQSDPQKAATAYQEAVIRDKIEAGCLNWHSSVAVAIMDITAR